MKITIFGVGAVAGFVAGRLARAGAVPTLVARGARLAAYRDKGLTLRDLDSETTHALPATDDTVALGPQDIVFLGVKAHGLPHAIDQIAPLVGPSTTVVPLINGIPFWYFHGLPGDWPKCHLDAVDPGGRVWNALGIDRVLGCVAYVMNTSPEPGVIQNHSKVTRIPLGEPAGDGGGRAQAVADLLTAAGFEAPILDDIRREIWIKLWGNLSGNSISALTEGTCSALGADPAIREVMLEMMREAFHVAAAYGIALASDLEALEAEIARRFEYFTALGDVPTSMLQDWRAGKSLELDPILGSVREMAALAGVSTPTVDTVYALARSKARIKGLYAPLTG